VSDELPTTTAHDDARRGRGEPLSPIPTPTNPAGELLLLTARLLQRQLIIPSPPTTLEELRELDRLILLVHNMPASPTTAAE
jgi:hypothetical protein